MGHIQMDDITRIKSDIVNLVGEIGSYFDDRITIDEIGYIATETFQLQLSLNRYCAGDDPQNHRFVDNTDEVIIKILCNSFPCLRSDQYNDAVCVRCTIRSTCWSNSSINQTKQSEKVKWVRTQIKKGINTENLLGLPELIPNVTKKELAKRKRELSKYLGVEIK